MDHRLAQSAVQYRYGDQREPTTAACAGAIVPGSRKRPASALDSAEDVEEPRTTKKRKSRTCTFCRSKECDGRWSATKCRIKIASDVRARQVSYSFVDSFWPRC